MLSLGPKSLLDSPNPLPKSGDCTVTSAPFFTRKLTFTIVLCLGGLAACSNSSTPQELTAVALARPMTVLDTEHNDGRRAVGARDDFYEYVNGGWSEATEIPADQSSWGTITELEEATQMQLKSLIEGLGSRPSDRTEAKIATLYASFMDEARLETLGVGPIRAEWERIQAIKDTREIPTLIAHFNQTNVQAPYEMRVHQDARDSTRYIVDIHQSGLGLPSRDYYLSDEAGIVRIREQYQAHIESMLTLAGDAAAAADAVATTQLETELAKIQWTGAENRDAIKTYNKYLIADLPGLTGNYDWQSYLNAAGIGGKVEFLIISQPSYLAAFGSLVKDTPLTAWKSYFKWHVLSAAAPYLSKALVEENFAFYGTVLRGIPDNHSRSHRGVTVVNELIGEGLGQLYVDKYFKAKTKDRVDAMVQVVLAAYRTRIPSLDWMSPETQKVAQQKLNTLVVKIGFPTKVRDYGKLEFTEEDLWGNVARGVSFEFARNIAKLGRPIDRDEWKTPPQTVTAYYDPQLNEIVFSAALLQPPLYDMNVDDAVNYGGIGVIISREIAHAFDEVGTQYSATGQLRAWLNGQDHEKFDAKSRALVAQYDANEPGSIHPVSGQRTLGENIADNAGTAIAYQSYHLALAGKEPPMIGGLTGDQRLFASFAQARRSKVRAEEAVVRLLSDRGSTSALRIDASLRNQAGFSQAFGLEQGDKMYLAPSQRVGLW
jgi:putative endopeptidase